MRQNHIYFLAENHCYDGNVRGWWLAPVSLKASKILYGFQEKKCTGLLSSPRKRGLLPQLKLPCSFDVGLWKMSLYHSSSRGYHDRSMLSTTLTPQKHQWGVWPKTLKHKMKPLRCMHIFLSVGPLRMEGWVSCWVKWGYKVQQHDLLELIC